MYPEAVVSASEMGLVRSEGEDGEREKRGDLRRMKGTHCGRVFLIGIIWWVEEDDVGQFRPWNKQQPLYAAVYVVREIGVGIEDKVPCHYPLVHVHVRNLLHASKSIILHDFTLSHSFPVASTYSQTAQPIYMASASYPKSSGIQATITFLSKSTINPGR